MLDAPPFFGPANLATAIDFDMLILPTFALEKQETRSCSCGFLKIGVNQMIDVISGAFTVTIGVLLILKGLGYNS